MDYSNKIAGVLVEIEKTAPIGDRRKGTLRSGDESNSPTGLAFDRKLATTEDEISMQIAESQVVPPEVRGATPKAFAIESDRSETEMDSLRLDLDVLSNSNARQSNRARRPR